MIYFGCGQEKQHFLFSKETVNSTLYFLSGQGLRHTLYFIRKWFFFSFQLFSIRSGTVIPTEDGENTLSIKDDIVCSGFSLFWSDSGFLGGVGEAGAQSRTFHSASALPLCAGGSGAAKEHCSGYCSLVGGFMQLFLCWLLSLLLLDRTKVSRSGWFLPNAIFSKC